MGFGELNRDLREVKNVPWQLTAVILAVFFGVPGTFLGTWGMLDAKGQGSSILAAMVAVPGYFMLLWGALGMRSRLKIAAANGEPVKPIRDKMLCGSAIFLVGLPLLAALSVGRVPALVGGAIGVPAGVAGIWLIMRAMVPVKRVARHEPRGIAQTTATSGAQTTAGAVPPMVLPPRPRRK